MPPILENQILIWYDIPANTLPSNIPANENITEKPKTKNNALRKTFVLASLGLDLISFELIPVR